MKSIAICLATLVLTSSLAAQEAETLLPGDGQNGGFGGATFGVTSLNGHTGIMLGGHGGWIIGHRLVLGGAGRGLVNSDIEAPITGPAGQPLHLQFGYGGLELQYINQPLKVAHSSLSLLVGGGSASYHDGYTVESSTFFVVEPLFLVTLNITRKIHLSGGGGYRWVNGISLPQLSDANLSGASAQLGLEFGSF